MPKTKINGSQITTPAFSAYPNAVIASASPGTVFTEVKFNTVQFDLGSYYDPATGRYTPKVAGYYRFSCAIGITALGDQLVLHVALVKNGDNANMGNRFWTRSKQSGSGEIQGAFSKVLYMNGTTDYASLFVWNSGGTTGIASAPNSWFDGHLLSAS